MPAAVFGVLFDVDDTLVDFSGAARLALLDVAASFCEGEADPGPAGERVLQSWEVVSEREYGRFLGGELLFDEMLLSRMAAMVAEFDPAGVQGLDPVALELLRNESIFTHYRQYDDVAGALSRLRAAGVPLGVISNSDGDYQRRKMMAAGLGELIQGAVFSGDLGVSKPDPDIFLAGASALGLLPHQVIYVGDRWATDALGALGAGLSAVWLNRAGAARGEQVVAPGEDGRLAELRDLHQLTLELAAGLIYSAPSQKNEQAL